MGMEVKADAAVKVLSTDLAAAVKPAAIAVAAEGQSRIAQYPPAPPKAGRTFYERGFGTRWRRKDGSVGGRKTSETLGRKWAIQPQSNGAVLQNGASYAKYVHSADHQATVHKGRWKTDAKLADALVSDGTVEKVVSAALKKTLDGNG